MNFLAPLYAAGILAISLPIIFHLIKRTPQGRQVFSSLMFLTPSPPRVTRRSRLNNIFLLILRATAFTLLALAFARPFLNQKADLTISQTKGKRVAIMVDTSASMQRADLWQQATKQVDQALADVGPSDEVALFLFDKDVRPAFTFKEWNDLDPSRRAAMLKGRLAEATPSWASTNLGASLSNVADMLTESDSSQQSADAVGRQVILISDMQQGGHAEALQGHQWPSNVTLDVKRVTPKDPTNASVQLVKESTDPAEKADPRLRVRVSNQTDSVRDQFTLSWADEKGEFKESEPTKIYVPPGRSQIVRVNWPTTQRAADRLILGGDDADFDNTLYVVQPRQDSIRIVYLGDDASDDPKGLRFYLERAASATDARTTEIIAHSADQQLLDSDLTDTRFVAVAGPQNDQRTAQLRKFIEQGGDLLWILTDGNAPAGLSRLAGSDGIQIEEASASNFALLGSVTMDHPLFAPFAESRFADFTKIHFWKHRSLKAPDAAGLRAIATFDNGDPFLLEHQIGRGRLWIQTSGWNPADSQLALSTKFVPLIDGMIKRKLGTTVESQHSIGEAIAIPLPPPQDTGQPSARSMRGPDGRTIELTSNATTFDAADRPGIYHVNLRGQDIPLAVNLSGDEARTAPMPVEELEQYGAKLGAKPISDEVIAKQRQLQVAELENKQKLWRWVIVCVLGLLLAETLVAGKLAHRQLLQQVAT